MHIGVVAMLDLLTGQTLVAAIHARTTFLRGLQAIYGLSECSGQKLQMIQMMTGEQIGMGQAPAFERALEQLHS
jgi:hypothetical protein